MIGGDVFIDILGREVIVNGWSTAKAYCLVFGLRIKLIILADAPAR